MRVSCYIGISIFDWALPAVAWLRTRCVNACRAFASWKEFVVFSSEKQAKLQKASKACFASSLQRAWTTWQAQEHRQKLLRRALESRQVSMPCSSPCRFLAMTILLHLINLCWLQHHLFGV